MNGNPVDVKVNSVLSYTVMTIASLFGVFLFTYPVFALLDTFTRLW